MPIEIKFGDDFNAIKLIRYKRNPSFFYSDLDSFNRIVNVLFSDKLFNIFVYNFLHWKILTFIMEKNKNKTRNQHILLIFRHPSHENIRYIANIWPL